MNNKNTVGLIIALVLVAVVAVLALTDVITIPNGGGSETPTEETDQDVVAVVNGEEITRGALNTRFAQTEQALVAQGQGAQLDDEAARATLESQLLDQLIAETLVSQQIGSAQVTVTDAEVEEQVQAILTQSGGEEEFATQLTEAGLTEEELRANIEDQLLTQKYLLSVIDVSTVDVTDEEVQAAYDEIAAAQEDVPPLDDEIRENLRTQLIQQEQNVLVNEHVLELREEAEVEVRI